jgi:tetratricopeptide (TPR) repeat protein
VLPPSREPRCGPQAPRRRGPSPGEASGKRGAPWRWALLSSALLACGRQDAPPRSTAASADASASLLGGVDGSSDGGSTERLDASATLAWPDALRLGRFAEAAAGLALLAAGEQGKPEIRLAKARVSIANGKPSDAIAALEKLDDELPLLRELVKRMRAQAMYEAGPFDKAAEYFGGRRDVASLILAAEAWDKTAEASKARTAWDRVIVLEKRTRVQEEKARGRRMQIVRLKEGDPAAAVDARWLTINALDEKIFTEAAELLEKLTPPRLLTAEELLVRARVLSEAMRSEEALRTIDRATTRGNIPALDLCRARAEVYWKARSRYPEAGIAYRTCAAMGGAHAAEDLFLAARAFSRADRDGDALPAFQSVIQKHARTTWADQAEFHLARTHALAGRWKDAALAFDEYAAHWPNGKEKREAERYRALAHLVSRNARGSLRRCRGRSDLGSVDEPRRARRTA